MDLNCKLQDPAALTWSQSTAENRKRAKRIMVGRCGQAWTGSRPVPVGGYSNHDYDPSGSLTAENFWTSCVVVSFCRTVMRGVRRWSRILGHLVAVIWRWLSVDFCDVHFVTDFLVGQPEYSFCFILFYCIALHCIVLYPIPLCYILILLHSTLFNSILLH